MTNRASCLIGRSVTLDLLGGGGQGLLFCLSSQTEPGRQRVHDLSGGAILGLPNGGSRLLKVDSTISSIRPAYGRADLATE